MRSFIGFLFCMSFILSLYADRIDEIERGKETRAQNRERNSSNRINKNELLNEVKAQYRESNVDDEINELESERQAAAQLREEEGVNNLPEAEKLHVEQNGGTDHIVPSQMEEDVGTEMEDTDTNK